MKRTCLALLLLLGLILGQDRASAQFRSTPEPGCAAEFENITQSMKSYMIALKGGRTSEANAIANHVILDVESDHDMHCHRTKVAAYLLGSLYLDNPFPGSYIVKMAGIVGALLENSRIVLLTPQLRTELSQQGRYDLWSKTKDSKYVLAGAYDCQKTLIFIDSHLKPLDVAATLVHELSHLFRDKLDVKTSWTLSPSEYVFMDEFLASLQGAFFQRILATKPIAYTTLFSKKQKFHLYFDSKGDDLTFFKTGGPFDGLWTEFEMDIGAPYQDFLKELSSNKTSVVQKDTRLVQEIIWNGYFRGKSLPQMNGIFSQGLSDPLAQSTWMMSRQDIPDLKLDTPSTSCRAFHDAIQAGALDGYMGVLTDGQQPGNGGVGTGNGGVGTGNGGVGTGNSGIGTEISDTIKPCLHHNL